MEYHWISEGDWCTSNSTDKSSHFRDLGVHGDGSHDCGEHDARSKEVLQRVELLISFYFTKKSLFDYLNGGVNEEGIAEK